MGDNNNNNIWSNLGEQFIDSVAEAINTRDFTGVNELVAETVSTALLEAKNQALREKERQREKVQRQYDDWQQGREEREREDRERREAMERERERQRLELQQKQMQWQQERREQSIRDAQARQAARTPGEIGRDMHTMIKVRKVGSVSSVMNTIFGALGIGVAVSRLIPSLIAMAFAGESFAIPVFWVIIGMAFISMIDRGGKQRARLNRAEKYIQICGYKMYGMVEELAKQTGKSIRFVRKDLRRMLKMGIFPEGHLDSQETCFMLNDTVYHQYEQAASAYRQAEEETRRQEAEANAPKSPEEQAAEEQRAREAELNVMVTEGREYIRRLRKLNDDIPGEPISSKLYQLESLLNEIFDRVKEHPEQMHRMHKVMEYYLPTTLKLVEAYKEFSEVSAPGPDILSAMAEIEKTLDTINLAFKELLNALFQDAALDVTTDAQVLQTMLAREGLTREMETLTAPGGADGQ